MTRTLFAVEAAGLPLAGTAHLPEGEAAGPGLLLLSFGHVARAGVGDLAARMGDRLAADGFPVFRVDMPGLGDSAGDVAAQEADFFREVQRGEHGPIGSAIARQLCETHALRGMVLGGLCGGGVTAIFAADDAPEGVAGLLLIEPDFSLVALAGAGTVEGDGSALTLRQRLTSTRSWLRLLSGESRFSRYLPLPAGMRRSLTDRLLRRGLPSDANRPLIDACARTAQRGVPILCITAEGKVRDAYVRAVEGVALAGGKPPATLVRLAGTNHVLSAGGGQERAFEAIEDWFAQIVGRHEPEFRR